MKHVTFSKAMRGMNGGLNIEFDKGYVFEVRGHPLVAHREYDKWACSDFRTGFKVSVHTFGDTKTRKGLIAAAQNRFSDDDQFSRLTHASSCEPQINELPNPA